MTHMKPNRPYTVVKSSALGLHFTHFISFHDRFRCCITTSSHFSEIWFAANRNRSNNGGRTLSPCPPFLSTIPYKALQHLPCPAEFSAAACEPLQRTHLCQRISLHSAIPQELGGHRPQWYPTKMASLPVSSSLLPSLLTEQSQSRQFLDAGLACISTILPFRHVHGSSADWNHSNPYLLGTATGPTLGLRHPESSRAAGFPSLCCDPFDTRRDKRCTAWPNQSRELRARNPSRRSSNWPIDPKRWPQPSGTSNQSGKDDYLGRLIAHSLMHLQFIAWPSVEAWKWGYTANEWGQCWFVWVNWGSRGICGFDGTYLSDQIKIGLDVLSQIGFDLQARVECRNNSKSSPSRGFKAFKAFTPIIHES